MSDEYPSNAHNPPRAVSARPQRERMKPVTTRVQVRKKPLVNRIADRGNSIWKDVLFEVIGPYFRDMFADSFYRAIDFAFYPEGGSRARSRGPRPGPQTQQMASAGYVITDYNSQYTGGPTPTYYDPRTKPFDFSIFTFPDYAAGREFIDRINHSIAGYGHATVNDLYDLLGQAQEHTGENYGWNDLNDFAGAEVRRVRGGGAYYLDIPDAKPLKK